MLFGNAVFSFVMSEFLLILATLKNVDKEISDDNDLNFFFNVIIYMNGGTELDHKYKHSIENFFEYYWNNDKNAAIKNKEELELLDQIPTDVQD